MTLEERMILEARRKQLIRQKPYVSRKAWQARWERLIRDEARALREADNATEYESR